MQENRRRYIKAIGLISIYHCLPANAGLFSLIGKTKAISKSADDIDTKPVDTLPNNNISIRESIDSDSENNKSSNDQETLSGSNTVDFQTKTIESLDEASFPKARKKLFTDISRLFDNSKIMFAKTSAKEFGKDFIAGAKEGNLRLDKLRNKSPKLVEPWLAIPKEKRVFIIAASQNQSEALLLKETLQKKGFECFYYRFCEHIQNELCDSKEVGAFFSTAGHVVTIKSRHSEASSYIPVELAVTDKFINGGVVIIFTPEDLIKSATALNVAIIVINESEKNE